MRIAIIGGTGYVGFCTGLGFALRGHHVTLVARTREKLDGVMAGTCPLYEPGADEALRQALAAKTVQTSMSIPDAIRDADAIFIAVGTPCGDDGAIDLSQIQEASRGIGEALRSLAGYKVVVVKSTVVAGTTETVVKPAIETASGKAAGRDFGLAMNPEFLREGVALDDFLKPDRIVIGAIDQRSGDLVQKLYADFPGAIMRTTLSSAEMIKYASNAFLATKISFINEIGNLCKILGIDTDEVAKGMALDKRISPHFLQSGVGYGGSCFPKDVSALAALAKQHGYDPKLLDEVMALNQRQRELLVHRLETKLGTLKGKRIAVLGLAFKPDTDDIRESPAIDIIQMLTKRGATVTAYDPQAMANTKRVLPDIHYAATARDSLPGADACLVLTDWKEFRSLKPTDFPKTAYVLEGKRILDHAIPADGLCW